jgi:hypothetical protein
LRIGGLDPFQAFQATLLATSALGMGCCFWLAIEVLRLRPIPAACLTCIAMLPNALATQPGHPQLASLHWLAVVAALGVAAHRSARRLARVVLGFAAGLLGALVTFSTFYVGWFALLALAICAVAALALGLPSVSRDVGHDLGRSASLMLAAAAGAAIGLVPFALTYGPVVLDGRSRTSADAAVFAMAPSDLTNMGPRNLLWGWLHDAHLPGDLGREWTMGFGPAFLALFTLTAISLFRPVAAGRVSPRILLARAAAIAAVALMLIPVHAHGVSLWTLVGGVVPGAQAIRVPARMWLVAVPLACVAIAASPALQGLRSEPRARLRHRRALAVGAIGALLLLEQVSLDTTAKVDLHRQRDLIALGATMPARCRSFFATGPAPGSPPWQIHLDAMIVALGAERPTINGYSGMEPLGFDVDPAAPDYPARAVAWARRHAMTDVCEVDIAARTWRRVDLQSEAQTSPSDSGDP